MAIVILSAFILGISLMVKEMAGMDPYGVVKLASPLLEKAGISTEKAGEVAGTFAERILKTNIAPSESYKEDLGGRVGIDSSGDEGVVSDSGVGSTSRTVVFKAVMMGDSENDNESLSKAIALAENLNVNRIFYLGDFTELGTIEDLQNAYDVMQTSNIKYYALPGDGDLDINANPSDHENYFSVFGPPVLSATINDASLGAIKFVMLNNSANYTVIDNEKIGQYYSEIEDADYVVMSQPLYHPRPNLVKPVMGIPRGQVVPDVRDQAKNILEKIRESDVKAIIAGDQHSFDVIKDPEKQDLEHVYIGAVKGGSLGTKSITLLSIYDDGSYSFEQIKID